MLFLITGASGSGKSEYAERIVCALAAKENIKEKIYLATMENESNAAKQRIARHQKLRQGKGFLTIEAPYGRFHFMTTGSDGFSAAENEKESETRTAASGRIVLLECISNLLANLMFDKGMSSAEAVSELLSALEQIERDCRHMVVVTNEVFSDGASYTGEMFSYISALGEANVRLAARAEVFCEVVYSVPVFLKGETLCPC